MKGTEVFALCTVLLLGAVMVSLETGAQRRGGGRNDVAIQAELELYLEKNREYTGVTARVEDGIVTLEGTVALYTQRLELERRAKGIRHVAGVLNLVRLEPPAVSDDVLLSRLAERIDETRFPGITYQVHEGWVTVSGKVRDYQTLTALLFIVWETPGVREVDDRVDVVKSR